MSKKPFSNSLETRTVRELFQDVMHYFIADYQRGYRWTNKEVEALLNDLKHFQPGEKSQYYSLQPVVVTPKEDNRWEVLTNF